MWKSFCESITNVRSISLYLYVESSSSCLDDTISSWLIVYNFREAEKLFFNLYSVWKWTSRIRVTKMWAHCGAVRCFLATACIAPHKMQLIDFLSTILCSTKTGTGGELENCTTQLSAHQMQFLCIALNFRFNISSNTLTMQTINLRQRKNKHKLLRQIIVFVVPLCCCYVYFPGGEYVHTR